MIELTRLNETTFWMNAEHIETIELTPDTVITLTNQKKVIVRESPKEVIKKVIEYKRNLFYQKID